MRDPARIDEFCKELAELWKSEVPDWRFGQLICNVFSTFTSDPFFIEDGRMIEKIKVYFEQE